MVRVGVPLAKTTCLGSIRESLRIARSPVIGGEQIGSSADARINARTPRLPARCTCDAARSIREPAKPRPSKRSDGVGGQGRHGKMLPMALLGAGAAFLTMAFLCLGAAARCSIKRHWSLFFPCLPLPAYAVAAL